jgi:ribose transport system permease protein
MTGRRRARSFGFERFSGLYLWALFIIVFAIWTPHLFLSQVTLRSVADAQVTAAMLALAVLVPLTAGVYDLSVGATVNLAAVVVVQLQNYAHWSIWSAILVAIGINILIGVVNGFIVVVLKVSSFIATLGMATILLAVQAIVSGQSQPLPPSAPAWATLTQFELGGIQISVLYLIVLAVVIWWLLEWTPFGRYMYAIGGNPDAARLAGVNVEGYTWVSLVISAAITGIAGVLYSSQNSPSLTFGSALLLPAFAAVFLGSTQLVPGRANVWGTLFAIYILATGVKGLQLVTGVQWLSDMFNGIALIGAVAFALWRQRAASELENAAISPAGTDETDNPIHSDPAEAVLGPTHGGLPGGYDTC